MTDKLIEQLRDEDSYYRVQEKHWCIDAEELERQRQAAADRIEAQAAEIERLREALEIWIFHHQRAMGEKPDVARQYAKAWMFRNANGEEPE